MASPYNGRFSGAYEARFGSFPAKPRRTGAGEGTPTAAPAAPDEEDDDANETKLSANPDPIEATVDDMAGRSLTKKKSFIQKFEKKVEDATKKYRPQNEEIQVTSIASALQNSEKLDNAGAGFAAFLLTLHEAFDGRGVASHFRVLPENVFDNLNNSEMPMTLFLPTDSALRYFMSFYFTQFLSFDEDDPIRKLFAHAGPGDNPPVDLWAHFIEALGLGAYDLGDAFRRMTKNERLEALKTMISEHDFNITSLWHPVLAFIQTIMANHVVNGSFDFNSEMFSAKGAHLGMANAAVMNSAAFDLDEAKAKVFGKATRQECKDALLEDFKDFASLEVRDSETHKGAPTGDKEHGDLFFFNQEQWQPESDTLMHVTSHGIQHDSKSFGALFGLETYDLNAAHKLPLDEKQGYATIVAAFKAANGFIYVVDHVLAPAVTPLVTYTSYHGPLQIATGPSDKSGEQLLENFDPEDAEFLNLALQNKAEVAKYLETLKK